MLAKAVFCATKNAYVTFLKLRTTLWRRVKFLEPDWLIGTTPQLINGARILYWFLILSSSFLWNFTHIQYNSKFSILLISSLFYKYIPELAFRIKLNVKYVFLKEASKFSFQQCFSIRASIYMRRLYGLNLSIYMRFLQLL